MKTPDGFNVYVVQNADPSIYVFSCFAGENGHFYEKMPIVAWAVTLSEYGEQLGADPVCTEPETSNEIRSIVRGDCWQIPSDCSGDDMSELLQKLKALADEMIKRRSLGAE